MKARSRRVKVLTTSSAPTTSTIGPCQTQKRYDRPEKIILASPAPTVITVGPCLLSELVGRPGTGKVKIVNE